MSTALPLDRRAVSAALGLSALFAPSVVRAAPRICRFTLDWAYSASSGFVLGALKEGFFRDEAIDLRVSRGMGSSKVPIDIAAGAYDLGFGDFNSMVQFVAEHPKTDMVCVLMVYDGLPLAVTSLSGGKIQKPADLEGCVLAAPDNDAGRQLFPVFADFARFDASKVKWLSVAPELREPMLARKQADAITGFISSTLFGLRAVGVPADQQLIMRYRDAGVPLYSNCIMTTRRFANANPDLMRGLLRAITRGVRLLVQDPARATLAVKEADPLIDLALETERARVVVAEMIATAHARAAGLSTVDAGRLERSIDILQKVYALARRPSLDEVYTDSYLPPLAQRMLT